MSVPSWHLLLPLGATLSELAAALGAAAYQDHYARDLGMRSPPAPAAGAAQQRGGVGCGVRGRGWGCLTAASGEEAQQEARGDRLPEPLPDPCRPATSSNTVARAPFPWPGLAGLAGQAAPPDMFKALHALLRGDRDGGFVPVLAQHRSAPVQRSADLLTCYSILADTVAAASAPGAQDPDQVRPGAAPQACPAPAVAEPAAAFAYW